MNSTWTCRMFGHQWERFGESVASIKEENPPWVVWDRAELKFCIRCDTEIIDSTLCGKILDTWREANRTPDENLTFRQHLELKGTEKEREITRKGETLWEEVFGFPFTGGTVEHWNVYYVYRHPELKNKVYINLLNRKPYYIINNEEFGIDVLDLYKGLR